MRQEYLKVWQVKFVTFFWDIGESKSEQDSAVLIYKIHKSDPQRVEPNSQIQTPRSAAAQQEFD